MSETGAGSLVEYGPMTRLREVVEGPRPLRGVMRVPGDKSISHRALILAGLAEGTSTIRGLSTGADVTHTREIMRALGAEISTTDDGALRVTGGHLREPDRILDVGNAGTGIRLLAGVCAGVDGLSVLVGDESIARRPMGRVIEPLRAMGARVDGRAGGTFPPLAIRGGRLRGVTHDLAVASAQVKSAVLLAGLSADGETVVRSPAPSRAHTEEMLTQAGVDVDVDGSTVRLRPGPVAPQDWDVPGDPSAAAFWIAGAAAIDGSDVTVENLYLGPSRAGFLDVLARMGADLSVTDGTVRVRATHLKAIEITADEIPALVDEVPALAVAAGLADGTTRIRGAAELRVKESDRIASTAAMMRAFGVPVTEHPDGMDIGGVAAYRPGEVDSAGDHRIAMAAVIGGLAAAGTTVVTGFDAVATSYPGFTGDLAALTA